MPPLETALRSWPLFLVVLLTTLGGTAWFVLGADANVLAASPALHTALATLSAAGLAVASLTFRRRWQDRGQRADLILAFAFGVLGGAALLSAVAIDLTDSLGHHGVLWTVFTLRVTGWILVITGVLRLRQARSVRPLASRSLALGWLGVGLLVTTPLVLGSRLPLLSYGLGAQPDAQWVYALGQLLVIPFLLLAGRGAILLGRERGESSVTSLGVAILLVAHGRFSLGLAPMPTIDFVHLTDLVRVTAVLVLALGCAREARRLDEERRAEALQRERDRIAAELHDGLGQDLALVTAQSRWMAKRPEGDPVAAELVATAAQNALRESRQVIRDLRHPDRQSAVEMPEPSRDQP